VLLVEDRLFNRKVAVSYLSRFGIEVTTAVNGQQALELARVHAFDLILMDVQMPVIDGFQATVAIRDEPGHLNRDTPILAMTAQALEGDRERCLQAGMDDYLTKPIRLELLERALRRWLTDAEKRPRSRADSVSTPGARGNDVAADTRPPPLALPAELESLFENDAEGLADLLRTFVVDARADLNALQVAWHASDIARVRDRLHALKGLVANMGFSAPTRGLIAAEDALRACETDQRASDALSTASNPSALEAAIVAAQQAVTALIEQIEAGAQGNSPG
jgi:CheY-like chemotaxis protein/HPt (histidine-containing phosphotransfer) domain-containing protein